MEIAYSKGRSDLKVVDIVGNVLNDLVDSRPSVVGVGNVSRLRRHGGRERSDAESRLGGGSGLRSGRS